MIKSIKLLHSKGSVMVYSEVWIFTQDFVCTVHWLNCGIWGSETLVRKDREREARGGGMQADDIQK